LAAIHFPGVTETASAVTNASEDSGAAALILGKRVGRLSDNYERERAQQFHLGPPPALTSAEYTTVFDEVKSLGIANSTAATADQALIGRFWNGAIQNYWNEVTQTAVQAHHLTTAQSARAFALLNLILADEVIAFYDTKYAYNLWRPVTAIRAAATDGNPDTAANPTWLPKAGKTAPIRRTPVHTPRSAPAPRSCCAPCSVPSRSI